MALKHLKQFEDINDCLVMAKKGDAEAQCYLGSAYDFRRQQVSQDYKAAFICNILIINSIIFIFHLMIQSCPYRQYP